jgi:two-component system OmpR family sensor kinase
MAGADMAEETDWTASSVTGPRHWSPLGAGKRLSQRTPLRTKLITAVLVLVMLALVAISFSSVYVLRSYLTTQNDGPVTSAYQSLIQELEGGATFNSVDTLGQLPGHFANVYAGLQQYGDKLSPPAPGGGIIGGGGNPLQMSVPSVPSTRAWATANAGKPITLPAQSGANTWRVIVAPYSGNGVSGTIVVGYDLGNINAEILQLIKVDVIVSVAVVVVLTIVAIGVVRANLRPLNDIELTAGQIAAGHLDHRVPEGDPRTEIGSLGRSLNAMLSQIERAFRAQEASEQAAHRSEERMRRFIADASHELRTPLTTIRGFAAHYRQRGGASSVRPTAPESNSSFRTDAADSGPATPSPHPGLPQDGLSSEDLDHLMGRVEAEATRMGLLVEDLLTLARLDQQRPLSKAPVDVLTLAADAVQDARIVSPGRPIDLIVAPGTAFLIDGDEPRLRQVLANLVNNAITHTPAGTPVRVKIARGTLETQAAGGAGSTGGGGSAGGAGGPAGAPGPGDWGGSAGIAYPAGAGPEARPAVTDTDGQRAVPAVVLDVEDDGPGMTTDQAQRVFERFYRADAARNRASGGTGLGLAIVAGLVSAHGGTVSVRTAPGQGADFQVKLPLSPDAQAVDDPDDDLPA